MILGIGVDIVSVADLERRLERNTLLCAFSDAERAYADKQPARRTEILAARWAAKEAFGKALGDGLRLGWPLEELEVVHDERGRPSFRLGPNLAAIVPAEARVHLSITHIPECAAAVVIIETPD